MKFCCFFSEWDGLAQEGHYRQEQWPILQALVMGQKNVNSQPFIILILPCIKLGALKNTVKAADESGSGCLRKTEISEDQKGRNQTRGICGLASQINHERPCIW
jgi:hypothetical protein